jgi:DNA-binding transcriptional regulator YiaG
MNLQTIDTSAALHEVTTSTSIFGRERLPGLSVIVVGGALSMSGTSSAEPNRVWEAPYFHEFDATASGDGWVEFELQGAEQQRDATREAVSELRRISGLTWEQLAQLFAVSRRSVHFWASGKPLNAENETRLLQVLDIVRTADRGDARSSRSALLDVHDGASAFDLLVGGRFEEARARLGHGAGGSRRPVLGEISAEAKAARAPLRPEELVEAQHDRVHRDPGHARAARTVRNSRRGTS